MNMPSLLKVCPKCRTAISTKEQYCVACHSELLPTNYSVIYWNKCSEEKKKQILNGTLSAHSTDIQIDIEQPKLVVQDMISQSNNGAVYSIHGNRGRKIDVYPNKCVITVDVTIGSIASGNSTDGEKTIYYSDCVGFQCKRPGFTIGYFQLETPGLIMNNASNNFFNENTFTYDDTIQAEVDVIVEYIKQQLDRAKMHFLCSPADELKKYKELLDMKAISQSEYDAKKAQLLNL